ncbi:MAG TPA: hypothetical protein VM943_01115 [Pyrinomonadaceae bacterium]|nr:hypothetical protein [Pyrinomonadaceae bacterium]
MKHSRLMLALVAASLVASISLAAQTQNGKMSAGEKFSGAWAGTFEGDATGKFEMSVTPGTDGKLGGTISVAPDNGGGYDASFKSVTVEGDKVVIKYDSPGGDGSEATLEGTGDSKAASGKWSIQSQGSQVASGTWKVTKKEK